MFSAFRRPGHSSDSDAVYAAISRSQAVIEFSLDGTILTANDNFLTALGYSLEEIRGKHHSLFVDPNERDTPAYRQFWTNLRSGQFESGEFKRIAKGGREVWIQATYNPVLDAAGKPVKIIKFALDVTAKVIDNRRIRVALDKVASNVMVADADGRIVYMNESVTTMFRNTGAEIRKELPQFDAERVLGSSFDGFHRSPSHQRNLLAVLKNTHVSEIKLGGVVLKIVATPVVDQSGNRLGTVVQWINRTTEVTTEDEVKRVVEAANTGNLSLRIDKIGKTGFFEVLAGGMNELLETNATLVREIQRATAEVSSSADEISKGNLNLSQRTEEQAASLEETASSMEQMTSTVRQNAENAATASQLAAAARAQAEKGGAVVSEAVAAMQGINAASNKIAAIIGVIDEIAFQTNLLALNAAVEAARAGDQGRGFAVVASEVRNLASRSAEAAKEIKALIQDSVNRVAQGSKLVDQSGQTLVEIVGAVSKVNTIVSEIAAASQEQASGIDQVNKAVTSMDQVTQQNAALVEEAAAAAESLLEQAQQLNAMMAKYQVADAIQQRPAPVAARAPAERAAPARLASKVAVPTRRVAPPRAHAAPSRASAAAASAKPADWDEF